MNNDELGPQFRSVHPRGAPPEVRSRVLEAVREELNASTRSRRAWLPGSVVAAALLAGIVLNHWAMKATDRRLALVLGPPPKNRMAEEIAEDVAAVTNRAVGRWTYDRIVSSRPRGDALRDYAAQLRMIRDLSAKIQEPADETPPKVPQMGRPVRGHGHRDSSHRQCVVCLEHGGRAGDQAPETSRGGRADPAC